MEGNSQEYGRPRRPNAETVSYLNGLPIDEKLASDQVQAYLDSFLNNNDADNTSSEAAEFPALVNATHAALSSVFNEIASLACEEIPAQQIETLVRIACRYSAAAKRVVLASLSGYWVFLSTHRFGSHVAQTVLRCAVAECEVNLDEFDDKQDECEGKMVIDDSYGTIFQENTSSVPELLMQAFEELKPFATDLTVHVCGTHVLRTALCILAGVEFVDAFAKPNGNKQDGTVSEWESGVLAATRRGKLKDKKKKKKKRKPGSDEGSSAENKATVMKEMNMIAGCQTTDFQSNADVMLTEMIQILSLSDNTNNVQPPGELQQRTCHPSGGPLLVQIVRLLSYRDGSKHETKKQGKDSADRRLGILPNEPKYRSGSDAEAFVHKLLCWDANIPVEGDDAKHPHAGDIIYGLSGEPRGSILLEAIFRSCPDEFHDALCVVGGFYDEATLKEYIYHGVSNFVVQALLNSLRNRDQANKMVKCLCPIIEDGSLLQPKKHRAPDEQAVDENSDNKNIQRMGIIWRAVEMCSNSGSSQDQEQLIHALMRGFASISAGDDDNAAKKDSDGKKKRSKSKGLSAKGCIPLLLGLTASSDDEEAYSSGERLTLNAAGARTLFHIFQFTERLRSDWVNGFLSLYGTNDLAKIANDGLGSRCIMDGLLDGPAKEVASKSLYSKLFNRLPFLAAERVGHHVVMKLFHALPYDDKAVMSAELSHSLNRLGSNAMGRSVMASCAVKEYLEGENAWREALAKQKVNEEWLKDILGEDGGSGDEAGGKSRKKRRKE
eukprot:scaffold38031_cov144-Skeletonema_dohrnii-CCMP3373.AAC.4